MKALILITAVIASPALADPQTPPALTSTDVSSYCSAFAHSGDGAWTATKQIVVQRPTGRLILMPGTKVVSGVPMGGMDLGAALEVQCVKK